MFRYSSTALVAAAALFAAGCGATSPSLTKVFEGTNVTFGTPGSPASEVPKPEKPLADRVDPAVTTSLVELFERVDVIKVRPADPQSEAFKEMLSVGSPIGYALRNRYLNPGVPLSEALSRNDDRVFREKLIEFARWGKDEVRAAALVVMAKDQDPAHLGILREALVHLDPGVRFGAIEALIVWGNEDKAGALLAAAAERDPEPILRVYAAQGLAKLGDPRGLEKLRAFLDDPGWLVRAMSARYLGEYGKAVDYTGLIGRIGREQGNDFVLAEYCIAALKLYRRKSQ